jgi:hypothetical protein
MATIDSNIALGVKPVQVENPMNQYAALSQIQSSQQANQLNALKMQEYERGLGEENKLRALLSSGADLNSPETIRKMYEISPTKGLEFQTKQQTIKKTGLEATKLESEIVDQRLKQSRQFLDTIDPSNPNAPALYMQWHKANHADPILGPMLAQRGVTEEQSLATIQNAIAQGPQAFSSLLNQSKMGVEKFAEANKPQVIQENLGGTNRVSTVTPYGGAPTVISTTNKTMTPGEKAVDARARERLDAEINATGTLSPQAIDVAANIYLQTGQLPALGIGKSAGAIKSSILNRATQLYGNPNGGAAPTEGAPSTTPTPFNASDMASNIVSNKIDNVTKTKVNKDFSTGLQGRQVTAFNTAIDHLDTMDKLVKALNNNDVRALNYISNTFSKQTGQPEITNFDSAKKIVGAEIMKTLVAGGGGVKEREEMANMFNNANSPAQLEGAIATSKQLLGGQLNSLGVTYENGTGRTDFNKKLTPAAKKEFDAVRGKTTESATTKLPAGVGADWVLKTDSKGNKAYVSPDNSKFVEVK